MKAMKLCWPYDSKTATMPSACPQAFCISPPSKYCCREQYSSLRPYEQTVLRAELLVSRPVPEMSAFSEHRLSLHSNAIIQAPSAISPACSKKHEMAGDLNQQLKLFSVCKSLGGKGLAQLG